MSNDQTQNVDQGGEGLSPEIADYFQVKDKAPTVESKEEVTPPAKEPIAAPNKTDDQVALPTEEDKKSEVKEGEKKPDEQKKDDKKEEDKTPAQVTKYSVAGVDYDTFDKAIEAVNRINGHNSKLVGDLTAAEQKVLDAENKLKAKEIEMQQFREANEAWKKYFDGDGERPEAPQVNLDELVEKKLTEREKQREQARIKEQFTAEAGQVVAKPDYQEVKAVYDELMGEYDGVPKVSPLTLYERAKAIVNSKNSGKSLDEIKKEIEAKVRKELAKEDTTPVGGKSGGGNSKTEEELSPEMADYLKNLS